MFEDLTGKFHKTFKKLTNKGVLSEANVAASLKEVKMALLEADVNYRVVNSFLKSVKKRALGQEVMGSLTPGQQFIKIVNDELVQLMGQENHALDVIPNKMSIIMMVGLQGSGKTTTAAKLANKIKKDGRKPYLVPADIYRPAAIDQLQSLAGKLEVPCYQSTTEMDVVDIVKKAKKAADEAFANFMIIDTAGRLHIDEALMDELNRIVKAVPVNEILFVADAMTGQDAVNVAKAFDDQLDVSGFILTKMDGDARGGASLSIRAITGKPVKFVGVGEGVEELDPFYPDRIASKILGMGDLLSLIDKAQEHFDEKSAKDMQDKFRKNQFTLKDFQDQLKQIQKMGSIGDLMGMIPGMSGKVPQNAEMDDKALVRIDAIINSMTAAERDNHNLINGQRKLRIAKGSGTQVSDINRLLKQFVQMKKMMKKVSGMKNDRKSMRALGGMFGGGKSPF